MFYSSVVDAGKCTLWMVAFKTAQLYLSTRGTEAAIEMSHTKIGGTGAGGGVGGGSNSIDFILFYNLHQFSLGSNNKRDMILSYDSRFQHISPNLD